MVNISVRRRIFRQRRLRQLLGALFLMALSIAFIIVPVEREVGRINNYFDGLWWAISTLTTVGYGDYVPVTVEGKLLGILLQVLGAMMFGMIIAIISSYVNRAQDEFYWNRLFERMDRLEEMLDNVRKKSDFMVKDGKKPDGSS